MKPMKITECLTTIIALGALLSALPVPAQDQPDLMQNLQLVEPVISPGQSFAFFSLQESLNGASGPPYPACPFPGLDIYAETNGSPGVYYFDDRARHAFRSMSAADDGPPFPEDWEGDDPGPPPPDIPNYQKFAGHVFSVIDTNDAAMNDTNLYNACLSFPEDTNTAPTLQIARYGASAVIIKANHFDYSAETDRDFALLVCDKVATPTWRMFAVSTTNTQDGWLVQGSVPHWKVADPMFLMVSNINRTYPAFFRAIPYGGPQVQLVGPAPYSIVSNVITLHALISDLSGIAIEEAEVTVDGYPPQYSIGPSNTISIDTRYNNAGLVNLYVTAFNIARVYDPTNPPDRSKLSFSTSASLPLDFENDTYVAFASDMCSPDVGTNFFLFVVSKPQNIAATITDPFTGQTVASYSGYVPFPATVELDWDFTEADGFTPYSNDTYVVTFTAFDGVTLTRTNRIDRSGVRAGASALLSYQWEDPAYTVGSYLNAQAETWIKGALQTLYHDLYANWSLTQYTPAQVGSGRNWVSCRPRDSWSLDWESVLKPGLDNRGCSDLTLGPAHGNGSKIGDSDFLPGGFVPQDLQRWCMGTVTNIGPNWRLRKAALWTCYSGELGLPSAGGVYVTTWPGACGIRPAGLQLNSFMWKNCGLFFGSELPQGNFGGSGASSPQVVEMLDQIWVCGKYMYPGGCDPTYSFEFAVNATRGLFNPELDYADPRLFGYKYVPYECVDDALLMMGITFFVKEQ